MTLITVMFLYQNLIAGKFGHVQEVQEWAIRQAVDVWGNWNGVPPTMQLMNKEVHALVPTLQRRVQEDEETRLAKIVDGILRSWMAEKGWKGREPVTKAGKAKNVIYL